MNNYPVIKIAVLFVIGIVLQRTLQFDSSTILIILFFAVILALLFLILKKALPASIFLYVSFLFLGSFILEINSTPQKFIPQEVYRIKNFTAYGKITDVELRRDKDLRFYLISDSINSEGKSLAINVKLLCRVNRSSNKLYNNLFPGNYVSVSGDYRKGREMRNPGEFDYNKYLNSKAISGIVYVSSSGVNILEEDKDFAASLLFSVRKEIDEGIKSLHNKQTSSLLRGLLLADRSEIDFDTRTKFINSGVIHVLAVSGLHVGFIAVIFIFLFGRFNIYLRSFLTIAGLLAFMFITGIPPSVFRATLMAVIIIIAFMLNRSTNLFNSLALAALIILFIDPEQLYNPGFQLSFSAVLGIALVYPPLEKFIRGFNFKSKFASYILLFMAVSLAAQIGTLPFTLMYFGKLSVVALIANMLVIPLIAVIVGLGIFTLILSALLPFLAEFSAAANELFTSLLFFIVRTSGEFEYSFIRIRDFSVLDALLFYIIMIFMIFYLRKFKSFTVKFVIIILAVANFYILSSLDNKNFFNDNRLSVFAVDVGQGDAILIRFPNGQTALIDAGDATPFFDNGERVILPLLDYLDIKQVDYAFVSHLDSDHYGGFISLIHAGKIKTIYKPPLDTSLSKDIKFEKFIIENDVRLNYYKKEIINIGDVRIYTLNHVEDFSTAGYSTNDKSGVKKMVYGNTSFMFTGDIERKVETVFASRYKDFLKSDLLKAAHHGSKTSSIPEFVNYVSPSKSIISAGIMNRFNHPSPDVVARLRSIGSEIYRTDKYGGLLFESDGNSIEFVDWRNR